MGGKSVALGSELAAVIFTSGALRSGDKHVDRSMQIVDFAERGGGGDDRRVRRRERQILPDVVAMYASDST